MSNAHYEVCVGKIQNSLAITHFTVLTHHLNRHHTPTLPHTLCPSLQHTHTSLGASPSPSPRLYRHPRALAAMRSAHNGGWNKHTSAHERDENDNDYHNNTRPRTRRRSHATVPPWARASRRSAGEHWAHHDLCDGPPRQPRPRSRNALAPALSLPHLRPPLRSSLTARASLRCALAGAKKLQPRRQCRRFAPDGNTTTTTTIVTQPQPIP